MDSPIDIERLGAVDWVTLNRPGRLNALDDKMIDMLLDYFQTRLTDESVRLIVLRGAGRAFCAGLDLDATRIADAFAVEPALAGQRRIAEIVIRMRRCRQPIVSLVHGAACGSGFALALASDIRIAGVTARMNAAFIRIGFSACDIGVSYLLPRLVGASLAAELMFTGNFIGSERALAAGLVSSVAPDDALENAARPILEAMLHASPIGLAITKEGLRMAIDAPSIEAAVALEDRGQILCAASPVVAEGIAAFREKRRPSYAGDLLLPKRIDRS